MAKNNMAKTEKKEEAVFDVLTYKDVTALQKAVKRKDLFFYGLLILVIFFLTIQIIYLYMRPISVVYNNTLSGEMIYMKGRKPKDHTTEISVKWFMQKVIELKSCQDPDGAINLEFLYNYMITPKLQKIWKAEKQDVEKGAKWFDKNAKADFEIEKIKIEGDMSVKSSLSIVLIGKMYFREAVNWNGTYKEEAILPVFVSASVQVFEQQERIPFGLLLDYYNIEIFKDEGLRKAFLIKSNLFQEDTK